jgi:outer membrane protein OmpA-like peptidoglycan-associated protein
LIHGDRCSPDRYFSAVMTVRHDFRCARPRGASLVHGGRLAALALALALVAGCHPVGPKPIAPTIGEAAAVSWSPAASVVKETTPAIALTASDGTGLRLVEVRARGWVESPLALTELHLTFDNPEDRTLEGNFEIQLPSRSAISRFSMKIGDVWQEGEVVERQAARRIFEDFLHRRQDPALLEQDAGERFRARVFPIPARGRKELIVTYSQELAGPHSDYRLPLAGLPRLETLDVRVLGPDPKRPGAAIELYRSQESAVASPGEIVLGEAGGAQDVGLRNGDLAVARVTIAGPEGQVAEPPRAVTVLFDTSASQAGRFGEKVAQLAALIERLAVVHGAALPLRVWCFDQEAIEVYSGAASGFSRAHVEKIVERRAFGASDPVRALTAIRAGAQAGERVVVVGDGVATAGEVEGGALVEAVRKLRQAGVARIDAIVVGGNRDVAAMTQLATADAGAKAGVVVDGSLATPEIVESLRRPTFAGIRVSVPGSRWTWPERLDGVQPGDTVLVYADLPADQALQVELDGGLTSPRVATRTVERPLLERAWVGARIARLLAMHGALAEGDVDMRRALHDQVVELSRKHRVLSPFTGLLVLESEHDYMRYGIRRDGLSDILAIGERGPELLRRDGAKLVVTSSRGGSKADFDVGNVGPSERGGAADVDGDGLVDGDDRCPSHSETMNGFMDEDGCPDEIPMQLARFTGTIKGIYFDPGSAKIRKKSEPVLDRALAVMREFAGISVEIAGHCAQGEKRELGMKRAEAVRDYLVGKGIDPARLKIRNGGLDEPVETNKSSSGRAKNRRMEFLIIVDSQPAPSWTPPPPELRAPKPAEAPAHSGKFADVMAAIASDRQLAVKLAREWCDREPGDVLALIALGDALAASGDRRGAARVYGSLIDLFPARADLRRHAGQRLATLGAEGRELAIDTYRQAVAQRPDHPTGHRLYAHALARAGRHAEAFAAIVAGLREGSSRQRSGVDVVMRADAEVLSAAWVARAPERRAEVEAQLQRWGITLPKSPTTSFVLTWETDANDVDLHVRDGAGGHAFYQRRGLPSGGALVADVTNGYGPEMFTIIGAPKGYPYTLEAHYYGQGPMGYGMGTLQVIEHDGQGGLSVDERPFVIMNAGARVPLGRLEWPVKK